MNKRQIGTDYEELAEKYLIEHGYNILQKNFRSRVGEIDIIAMDKEYYCFIEVKYRSTGSCGSALEAVTLAKQKVIRKVALYYMMINKLDEWTPCRFDVVAIDGDEITLIKNAF